MKCTHCWSSSVGNYSAKARNCLYLRQKKDTIKAPRNYTIFEHLSLGQRNTGQALVLTMWNMAFHRSTHSPQTRVCTGQDRHAVSWKMANTVTRGDTLHKYTKV